VKSLKIYLASSFDLAARCAVIEKSLKELGHTVPDVWWNIRTKNDFTNNKDDVFYSAPLVQAIAARHWNTIRECDLVILVSGDKERTFTGANVEVGYALGLGKTVLSIGHLKRSAMYVPIIKCWDMTGLLYAIQCIAQEQR